MNHIRTSASEQKERMIAGLSYDPRDPTLIAERRRAHALCYALSSAPPDDAARKSELLRALFGKPVTVDITPPFYCDYGCNITFGDNVYFNFNCVLLDIAPITIGRNVLFGPGVHIYAATHPLTAIERQAGLESGAPVTIADDVWVGGGAIICPGVTIGAGTVVGAGSVVTRDVPARVFAAGNPCRVIRSLVEDV